MFPLLSFVAYAPPNGTEASAPTTSAPAAGGGIASIVIWLVIMVALFYFMIIMPQRKRDKQFKQMMASLKTGDNVVTAGGIIGKVILIKGDSVRVRTGNGSELDVTRRSVSAIVNKGQSKDVEPEVKVEDK